METVYTRIGDVLGMYTDLIIRDILSMSIDVIGPVKGFRNRLKESGSGIVRGAESAYLKIFNDFIDSK